MEESLASTTSPAAAPGPGWETERMRRGIEVAEKYQVPLYLAAILAGGFIGLAAPDAAPPLEAAVTPALGVLLTVTFLGVPFRRILESLREVRFLLALLVLNFVLVPALVFALSRLVAEEPAVLFGVLLVLLTPCVDYVVVFTRLAGGAADRLLAATPLLMIGQLLALPLFLRLFAGAEVVAALDLAPIATAFLWLILVPLLLAGALQALARRVRSVRALLAAAEGAMVPLMMLVLALVLASQLPLVAENAGVVLVLVPLFLAFALGASMLGTVVARAARLPAAERRAVVFSGITRNSLVVLPLALATPFALAPAVVVTQTLVELLVMVALTMLVPRWVTDAAPSARNRRTMDG